MLEKLGVEGERIFNAELSKSKKRLVLRESCDEYYHTALSKRQVIELISDLQKLADDME